MSLQYLDALKEIGASPATKLILPMELTTLMHVFGDFAARAADDRGEGRVRGAPDV